MIVPPIKIQGKKTRLIPVIMEVAGMILDSRPDIDTWVEPFLGSGTVAFNCPDRISRVTASDVNPHVIAFYRAVQDGTVTSESVGRIFTEHGRRLLEDGNDYYLKVRDRFNESFSPMDFLFLTRTGFNGVMRFNRSGKWNIPFCKIRERLSPGVVDDICLSVESLSELFSRKRFDFRVASFEETIGAAAEESSIFYCDPPYYGLSTTYFRGWGRDDEIRLRNMLEGKTFIYSTWMDDGRKENPMIGEWWGGYPIYPVEHKYNVAGKASDRSRVREAVIHSGFPGGGGLF